MVGFHLRLHHLKELVNEFLIHLENSSHADHLVEMNGLRRVDWLTLPLDLQL